MQSFRAAESPKNGNSATKTPETLQAGEEFWVMVLPRNPQKTAKN